MHDAIAIVGAGPAGASLAYYLRCEFPDAVINIYEKSGRVGGQSETFVHNNVLHEMGTIYTTIGYWSVKKLISAMNLTLVPMQQNNKYIDERGDIINISNTAATFQFAARHLADWLPWKLHGREFAPSTEDAEPWGDTLARHGQSLMDPCVAFATTGQLYGPPSHITKHNAYNWFKPSVLITGSTLYGHVIKEGWEVLWKRLVDTANVNVIHREIKNTQELREPHIFVTVPLDSIQTPISRHVTSFDDDHVLSFVIKIDKYEIDTSVLYGFAYPKVRHIVVINAFPCDQRAFYDRREPTLLVLVKCKKRDNLQMQIEKAKKELKYFGDFGKAGDVLQYRFYRYNVRYTRQQIVAQLPQKIDSLQGKGSVWYSGGGMCHWNVNSIVNFNIDLVRRFVMQHGTSMHKLQSAFLPWRHMQMTW